MDWKTWYQEHLCPPQQAVRRIRSGDRVVVAHATGEPSLLLDAMVANAAQYEHVEIVHMVAMGKAEYCQPAYDRNFHHNSFFLGATSRAAAAEGRADFTPVYFSEIPALLRDHLHPNVALIQVSPPDEHGYCSLGVSVDYTKTAAEEADLVIAQVNQNMPRTLGDSFLHVTRFDCIVESCTPVIELPPPKISQVERAIGQNVAQLVRDGDTLQLGIGAIPDAVLLFLKEKNDLGIHTEMFSDGVVELAEAGNITNQKKTLHRGQSVATFLMGTRRLYDYVDNNPAVAMYPVQYVNDPYVIAGQGTIGLEILEDVPNVTDVVVPLGGGGLGAGVALAIKTFKPEVRVIGAIPEGSPAWKDSLAAGRVSPADHVVTSAEGVAVKHPGDLPFALINEFLDDLVTVTERTREIGIRKAIGAERKSIIAQFLIEACMICGIGGLFGIAAGYIGTLIVGKLSFKMILWPSPGVAVGSFFISVALGVIFGLYPAIKASGLQPVDALRAD